MPFEPYGLSNAILYNSTLLSAGLYKLVDCNFTLVVDDCGSGTVPSASLYDLSYDNVYILLKYAVKFKLLFKIIFLLELVSLSDQCEKTYPGLALAVIVTSVPAVYSPPPVTVPAPEGLTESVKVYVFISH